MQRMISFNNKVSIVRACYDCFGATGWLVSDYGNDNNYRYPYRRANNSKKKTLRTHRNNKAKK